MAIRSFFRKDLLEARLFGLDADAVTLLLERYVLEETAPEMPA